MAKPPNFDLGHDAKKPAGPSRRVVLITGAAGFLGSHLVERHLKRGDFVIALDNMQTGDMRNLEFTAGFANFQLIDHDVIEPIKLKVDYIYNFACAASPPRYQLDPIHTFKTSILGAINMLELAQRNNARIVQASTSEIYGEPLVHPQAESYWGNVNPIGIRSCYDEGKRGAETLFSDYRRHRGIDARLLRIFNTYGPRMRADDGRVVSNFICQALQGDDLTIYGEGEQTRSFCYVDDLIDGIIAVMDHAGTYPGPINLGNGHEVTVRELADKVIAMTGSKSRIVQMPLPEDDPTQRSPDITLAKKTLGWEPAVGLEQGLAKTIAYFKSKLKDQRTEPLVQL